MFYVKPDHFFAMPLYTNDGVLSVDGKALVSKDGAKVMATKYLNAEVG
jgi:methionyl-tRNA synthetase